MVENPAAVTDLPRDTNIAAKTGTNENINTPAELTAETQAFTVLATGKTTTAVIPKLTTYFTVLFSL